jgi:hypothetical protein
MAEQVARGLGGQLSQPTLMWPSKGGRWRLRAASGCGGRRGFFLAVGGGKRTPAVGVAAPAMERRRSARRRETQGRRGGNGLEPLSAGPGADKEGGARGHAGCPGRRILGPNLRPEWVHADAFRQLCLFGSPRWAVCSVRANAFGRGVVVCISPLEMPIRRFDSSYYLYSGLKGLRVSLDYQFN